MKKVLTISIAAYNAESCLAKCLDTFVKCKELDKLEIIVVDDGSTDDTKKIALDYCARFPESIFLVSKTNGGHGSTINTSIVKATGEYFKIVDSDDWIEHENLDRLVEFLKHTRADIIMNPYYEVDATCLEHKKLITPYQNIDFNESIERPLDSLVNNIYLYMHAMTFRTECLKKMGPVIDEKCFYVDTEYTIFPIKFANTVALLKCPIYDYLLGTETQSMNIKNMVKRRAQHFKVTKRLVDFYNTLSDELSDGKLEIIRNRIIGVIIFQYIILFVLDGKDGKREIKEFDMWLKQSSEELYNAIPCFAEGGYIKVVLFARRTKFIMYTVYHRLLKSMKLIK